MNMGTTTENYMTDKPFYRATRDSKWFERALTEAQHLFVKNDDGHMFCAVHQQDASVCAPPTRESGTTLSTKERIR
jgi:hypothetical protein